MHNCIYDSIYYHDKMLIHGNKNAIVLNKQCILKENALKHQTHKNFISEFYICLLRMVIQVLLKFNALF